MESELETQECRDLRMESELETQECRDLRMEREEIKEGRHLGVERLKSGKS